MPKNTLVLTSGGILGVTYGGVFRCMEERGISLDSFTEIYGTSIGALIGLLVMCNISYINIRRLLRNLPVSKLFQVTSEGLIGFADYQGIDRGYGIRSICNHILSRTFQNPNMTFGELGRRTGKHFVVNATNVRKGEEVIFGTIETPDIRVEDAVIASASIPFLYTPVRLNNMVLVDGGVTRSLLLKMVPKEDLPTTIAVVPMNRVDHLDIEDVPGMAKSVYYTMANTSVRQLVETCGKEAEERIIYIRTPLDTTIMLGQEADDPGIRETLDFLGYTEANRSPVILNFGKSPSPTPTPTTNEPQGGQGGQNIMTPTPDSQTSQPIQSQTTSTDQGHSTRENITPGDSPDQPSSGQQSVRPFLPPPNEESGMTELPPRGTPSDPPRSLPPPIETKGSVGSSVTPPVYRPVV
jgi:NTE family protein